MSDIKIGDKVVGIKGATKVAGTVMNIKEGHVYIKAPVSGVYAPVVSIVPMHKVTKLGEGAMKRKAEDEDDGGMSDYMHHVQTSKPDASEVSRDAAKKAKISAADKEKLANIKKLLQKEDAKTNPNQEHAVHVAGQPVRAYSNATHAQNVGIKLKQLLGDKVSVHHMKEEIKPYVSKLKQDWQVLDHSGKVVFSDRDREKALSHLKANYDKYRDPKHVAEELQQIDEVDVKPKSAKELNPGLSARIDAASNAQKPRPLAGMRPIDKIKLLTRKEEFKQVEESAHSTVNNLKADGKHEDAGAAAFEHGLGRKYGQHFGLRSTKDQDEAAFHRGYDRAEAKSRKKVDEEVEQIDEKMFTKKAVTMHVYTQKDGKPYKGKHTVVLNKVPTLDTPKIQAQTRDRAETSIKRHLKAKGHTVTDIEHLEEGWRAARAQGTAYGRRDISGKSSFKSREHEHEAAVEAQHTAEREARESEPHHVYINHKVMRDKVAGTPVNFNGKKHAKAVAAKLVAKYPNMTVHTVHHSYTEKNGGVIPEANT